eukprot:CAMPEP_0119338004 /NCGR_PEP_ID=MMETSP1333-20130426/95160_1 /TAXON_ID=418940 /ORGANISM="Scyphosphaera apsteinii, Strain RCC1455" /LENGTH=323 /DNA_ID=CAMNT_0007349179 /DNA_START=43 /DNA_END=1014 /DNA_ORIENTATION=-
MAQRPRKRTRAETRSTVLIESSADDAAVIAIDVAREHAARADPALQLYEAGTFSDGAVTLNGRRFEVSRVALATSSNFFREAFAEKLDSPERSANLDPNNQCESTKGTVDLNRSTQTCESTERAVELDPSLNTQCVEALLRFAHVTEAPLQVPASSMHEMLNAARQLGFVRVVATVIRKLARRCNASNVLMTMELAGRHDLPDLMAACVPVISDHFDSLLPSLPRLSCDCFALLLARDDITVDEVRLVDAVFAWYASDPTNRLCGFERLFPLLRLTEIGVAGLARIMYAAPVPESASARQLVQRTIEFLANKPHERAALTAVN